MIRALALLALMCASAASADNLQGLTLGAPMPGSVIPQKSTALADGAGSETLTPFQATLCLHDLVTSSRGHIQTLTEGCDGAVIMIVASSGQRPLLDPDAAPITVQTGLPLLTFNETTLAEVRAFVLLEGLISPPGIGQQTPQYGVTFTFAYEVERSDAYVLFKFGGDRRTLNADVTPDIRDATRLDTIFLMDPRMFSSFATGTITTSAGYVPIPNIFNGEDISGQTCGLS